MATPPTRPRPGPLRRYLTFANVCSLLALVIATSTGVSYAAVKIRSKDIVNGQVKTVDLAKNAVTSAKIRNQQVKSGDLAPGAVSSAQVKDGSLAAIDVLLGSLTGDQVADGSLGTADLADNAVTAPLLAGSSVGTSEIQDDGVGASEISDNSIDGGEVVDNSLGAGDLALDSVGASELASNSVAGANVVNNSLTFSDIQGGAASGNVSIPAGGVANGRCENFGIAVGGAVVGDAVVFSVQADMQDGVFWYGLRVSAANTVDGLLCNFSGGAQAAISNLPVRIFTFQ